MNAIHRNFLLLTSISLLVMGCQHNSDNLPGLVQNHDGEAFGSLEVHDPRFLTLIARDAPIEKLASGFDWSEGPVWIKEDQTGIAYGPKSWRKGGYILFSDIPNNAVYRWAEGDGISVFLEAGGYTGDTPRGGELGSNGLTTDSEGRLVLCEHGNRRVGRVEPDGSRVSLVNNYHGNRFNSPNDLAYKSNGDLYFTDPPYGLEGGMSDPNKELSHQGVYRLTPSGELTLLTDKMSRPNGIAFSPDEKTLYVANSHPKHAVWMAYSLRDDGTLGSGRVFFDSTPKVGPVHKGLPDGLKVDTAGNLFATGPGGVLVFAPDGTHLGTINTGEATANCAFGDDGSMLYITADMYLCRIQTKTKGVGF